MNHFQFNPIQKPVLFFFAISVFIFQTFPGSSQSRSAQKDVKQTKCLVPFLAGDYVPVYIPQGDVFPGPDTKDLKTGTYYPLWQPNDHCFVKGPDKRWHALGITHPASEPGQSRHQGEYTSFHAVSSGETFENSCKDSSWTDKPKVLSPAERPGESSSNHAPVVIKEGKLYKMIYGPTPFRMATSEDLYKWTPKGPVGATKALGRDPNMMVWNKTYYLVYCAGNSVKVTTSKDLQNWTDPVEIFKPEVETYQCESPTLLHYKGKFYLFWCLWDTAGKNNNGYDARTFVYYSDNPLNFNGQSLVTELQSHAPEIFQGEKNEWYISSAQYPQRGISVARLSWK